MARAPRSRAKATAARASARLTPRLRKPARANRHVTAHTVTLRTGELFRALGMTGSIHRLRATYATNLRRNGVDLKVIQELMRHDSLSATEHYLGVDEDERAAAIRTLAAVS